MLWHFEHRVLTSTLAALIGLAATECAPELRQLECTRTEECDSGQVCRVGLCQAVEPGDTDVAEGEPALDTDVDGLDGDFDTDGGDAGDAADLPVDAVSDAVDLVIPDVPIADCPQDFDCLDPTGTDEDADGSDGTTGQVVLVDPVSGNDENTGLPGEPVATLGRAFELVASPGRRQILLATSGPHVVDATIAIDDLDFFEIGGGYPGGGDWSRGPGQSEIVAAGDGISPLFALSNMGEVRLSQVAITGSDGVAGVSGSGASDQEVVEATPGQSSVVIDARESFVVLTDCLLEAGDGGDGGQGRVGRVGLEGGEGTNGASSAAGDLSYPGGDGGAGPVCYDGLGAYRGGDGGDGGLIEIGTPGENGASIDGATAGGRGGRATNGDRDGDQGDGGGDGDEGLGGGANGQVVDGAWVPRPGESGDHGVAGEGGGGGASGGGLIGGRGGGGGGSGGCGGEGGGGGAGGGGSIALLLLDATATLDGSTLRSGQGGEGAPGGSGGIGGDGADGRPGGTGGTANNPGGAGGGGGQGGRGGIGGGGAGGLAVPLVLTGSSNFEGGTLEPGEPGAGGTRSDYVHAESRGATGAAGESLRVTSE